METFNTYKNLKRALKSVIKHIAYCIVCSKIKIHKNLAGFSHKVPTELIASGFTRCYVSKTIT